jgi:hypothetical protein
MLNEPLQLSHLLWIACEIGTQVAWNLSILLARHIHPAIRSDSLRPHIRCTLVPYDLGTLILLVHLPLSSIVEVLCLLLL